MTDPTGHRDCDIDLNCGPPVKLPKPRPAAPAAPIEDPHEPSSNLITHLPLDRGAITGQSGFGPNWYATYNPVDCPNRTCYEQSHNIHTGLDLFAPAGSTVYAAVSGTIVAIYSTDADPNIVIAVTVGEITYYVVHGHVAIDAAIKAEIDEGKTVDVTAGRPIGTIAVGENHVHLGIRRKTEGQDRAYNPLLFMVPDLTVGMNFVSDKYPYYDNESPTSMRSFLYGSGSYYIEDKRNSMGIIR